METKLYMSCMPFSWTVDDIRRCVAEHGEVTSVEVFQDLEEATFESYAHIGVKTDNLDALLFNLDGKPIGTKVLRVNRVVQRVDTRTRLEETA